MKYLLTTLIIIGGMTPAGTYIFGFSVPLVTSIATEWQNDEMIGCVKWVGEARECSISEIYLMQTLYKLHK